MIREYNFTLLLRNTDSEAFCFISTRSFTSIIHIFTILLTTVSPYPCFSNNFRLCAIINLTFTHKCDTCLFLIIDYGNI